MVTGNQYWVFSWEGCPKHCMSNQLPAFFEKSKSGSHYPAFAYDNNNSLIFPKATASHLAGNTQFVSGSQKNITPITSADIGRQSSKVDKTWKKVNGLKIGMSNNLRHNI